VGRQRSPRGLHRPLQGCPLRARRHRGAVKGEGRKVKREGPGGVERLFFDAEVVRKGGWDSDAAEAAATLVGIHSSHFELCTSPLRGAGAAVRAGPTMGAPAVRAVYQRSACSAPGRSKIHGRGVGATRGGGTNRTFMPRDSRTERRSAAWLATKSVDSVSPAGWRKRRLILAGRRAARVFTTGGRRRDEGGEIGGL
jgi:hypothetical protein